MTNVFKKDLVELLEKVEETKLSIDWTKGAKKEMKDFMELIEDEIITIAICPHCGDDWELSTEEADPRLEEEEIRSQCESCYHSRYDDYDDYYEKETPLSVYGEKNLL